MDVAAVVSEVDSISTATEMHVLMLQKWKHPVLLRPVINSEARRKRNSDGPLSYRRSKIESPQFS